MSADTRPGSSQMRLREVATARKLAAGRGPNQPARAHPAPALVIGGGPG